MIRVERPSFAHAVQQACRKCYYSLKKLVIKVIEAVKRFFVWLFAPWKTRSIKIVAGEEGLGIKMGSTDWWQVERRLENHGSPASFIEALDSFPARKMEIKVLAIAWARRCYKRRDPKHPYFEIFQNLDRLEGKLEERKLSSDEHRYSKDHVETTLLVFQELSRPENQTLMQKLNDKNYLYNSAYRYADALAGFPIYPTGDLVLRGQEELNKLFHGIEGLWTVYQECKERDQLLDFFEYGFKSSDNCFDARVSELNNLKARLEINPDFVLQFTTYDAEAKIYEYFRVFKNLQIDLYCRRHNLTYREFRGKVLRYGTREISEEESRQVRDLYRQFITESQFLNYLQRYQSDYLMRLRPRYLMDLFEP